MKNFIYTLISLVFLVQCATKKENEKPQITAKQVNTETNKVVGVCNIEPVGKILPITSEVNGIIINIAVEANSEVKRGQTLMTLDYRIEESQLAQARSKLATQQAIIRSAQASVASLQVKLENNKSNYERNQNLFNGGAATQQVLDDSKFQYEQIQKDIQASQAIIAQQESRLNELQADINYYQTLLERKTIKALTDGKVLSIDTKIGTAISNTNVLGDFAPAGNLMAITEIDELFADKIIIGQSAFIRPQGSTEVIGKGKVIFTSPYLKKKSLFSDKAENLEDRRVREVRVELEKNEKLLIGSRLECVIELKTK